MQPAVYITRSSGLRVSEHTLTDLTARIETDQMNIIYRFDQPEAVTAAVADVKFRSSSGLFIDLVTRAAGSM